MLILDNFGRVIIQLITKHMVVYYALMIESTCDCPIYETVKYESMNLKGKVEKVFSVFPTTMTVGRREQKMEHTYNEMC